MGEESQLSSSRAVSSGEHLNSVELKQLRNSLLNWFRSFQRDLPWRKNRDPYRVWISEIMLQQTRVAAVIPYYERFLSRFPNVKSLAEAPQDEVLRLWSGLGYYSRARNLQTAAQQILTRHAGEFPRTREELLVLSGIGEYTAAAILSIAFGEQLAVLDGNVARVIARLNAIRGDLREPQRWRALQASATELLACESAGDWNQAMMELGATMCTPKSPQCLLCPVAPFCEARKLEIVDSVPEKRQKRANVTVQLISAVLLDSSGKCLLLPPPPTTTKSKGDDHVPSLVAKLWHFPTISAPASGKIALKSLLHSNLGMASQKSAPPEPLEKVRHTVTYRLISVSPYLIRLKKLPKIPGAKHLTVEQTLSLPVSNLTRKIARNALKHLSIENK